VFALALTGCAGADDDRLIPGYYDSQGTFGMDANESWESGGSTYGGCEPWDEDGGEPWDEDAGGESESESDSGGEEEACEALTDDTPDLEVILSGLEPWAAYGAELTPWCGWLGNAMPGYQECLDLGLVDVELSCSLTSSEDGLHSFDCTDGDTTAPVVLDAGLGYPDHELYVGTGGSFTLRVHRTGSVLDGGGHQSRTVFEAFNPSSYTLLFAGAQYDAQDAPELPWPGFVTYGLSAEATGCPEDNPDPKAGPFFQRLELTVNAGSKSVSVHDGERVLTDTFEFRAAAATRHDPDAAQGDRYEYAVFRRAP
jgi:hypothetical protein